MSRIGRTASTTLLLFAAALFMLASAASAGATLPPGENGLVTFEDAQGINGGDIWTAHADGSQPRQLTHESPAVEHNYPTFSANGSRIFFVRKVSGSPDSIWSMALDGSDQRMILAVQPGQRLFGLAASPNGTKLAFTLDDGTNEDIWIAGVDGSAPRDLTNTRNPQIFEEVGGFSPDGHSIVYKSCVGMNPCDVAVMVVDGSGQHLLTNTPTQQEDFSNFSPDGRKIAFERSDSTADIWTMNPDGSGQVDLTSFSGKNLTQLDDTPVYSGDGKQIYFSRCISSTCDLWTVPTGGGAANNLTAGFSPNADDPDAQSIQRCDQRQATIVGDDGANTILGTNGPDVIDANGANDLVNGLGGRDLICGEGGHDILKGGKGKDRLIGGPGRDKLVGGMGVDQCVGGKGKDRAKGCEKTKAL